MQVGILSKNLWFRAATVIPLVSMACGGIEDSVDQVDDALIGGTESYARTEVGEIIIGGALCTATLVRPNVAITAAHCVDFETRSGVTGSFILEQNRDSHQSFAVAEYTSLGSELGDDDIAIVRLSERVPSSLATPSPLADRAPTSGELVTSFGYGCTDRAKTGQPPIKRRAEYAYPQGRVLCPGDSGGPGFLGASGPLALIHSGYWVQSGLDIHAKVGPNRGRVDAILASWDPATQTPPAPPPVVPPPVVPPPVTPPTADPNACLALGAQGGVLEEDGNCATHEGDPRYLRAVDGGSGGYIWTGATNSVRAHSAVNWTASLTRPGLYKVEAYVAAGAATSRRATYDITHLDGADRVTFDQSGATGYVELGYFRFTAEDGVIRLGDNTGEAASLSRRLVFDAIRLTPVVTRDCPRLALIAGLQGLNVRPLPSTELSPLTALNGSSVVDRLATVPGENVRGDIRWHRIRGPRGTGYVSAALTRCVN
ncbi:MAG: trypsin-like serine protease [Deltaproteobacteria bacterium]|nr:trypsin-like serine protease [Deltaproteobacteria bacterium]